MKDDLVIGGKELSSRFLLGTGKFRSKELMRDVIIASGAQVVTVALRRIDLEKTEENILSFIPEQMILMVNTSGARNASEAVRIAHIAKEAGYGNWVKIEVINDSRYLLPDNTETVKATEILASEGFVVLPYMHPDLSVARELVKVGAAAVMPLGSLIGSNQGLKMRHIIEVLIEEIDSVPVIVDAGIGRPSHAAEAMEIGADAVLINTAVAVATDPVSMARAFALGIEAGRLAYLARGGAESSTASASSPLTGFLYDDKN
jgi:thiazole synthase